MTKADFRMFQEILESQLRAASTSRQVGDSIHIHRVADPLDMTQEAAQRDVAVQILDRESAQVRRLRSAIGRINDGSYGFCLQCEEEIAPKRLRALPWAELCIHCQEEADGSATRLESIAKYERWSEAA